MRISHHRQAFPADGRGEGTLVRALLKGALDVGSRRNFLIRSALQQAGTEFSMMGFQACASLARSRFRRMRADEVCPNEEHLANDAREFGLQVATAVQNEIEGEGARSARRRSVASSCKPPATLRNNLGLRAPQCGSTKLTEQSRNALLCSDYRKMFHQVRMQAGTASHGDCHSVPGAPSDRGPPL